MSSAKLKKIIVVLGPTASGKSELAVKLARQFNGEIVSADSRQIYKGMDIGTAKTKNIHLTDIVRPDQDFTLAQYKKLAVKKIKDIHQRGKLPFLVGGTGLYIQAIVDNLKIPEVKPNAKLRAKLEKEIEEKGLQKVYQKLIKLDPQSKSFVDPKNPRRIIRALEVCLMAKKPFSQSREKGKPLFDVLQIGLKIPQEKLDKKIGQRVEKMMQAGLVEENKKLIKKYSPNLPALNSIGYKEIIQYLQRKIALTEAKKLIKLHTRQYARRQMTWFKKHPAPEQVQCRTSNRIKWIKNYQQAAKLVATA